VEGTAKLHTGRAGKENYGADGKTTRNISDAFGGLGGVIARLFGRGGNVLTAVLGTLLALDVMLVAGFGFALKYLRPRLVERLRS